MSEERTVFTFKPVYMIKAYGRTVKFTWSSNPERPLKGSIDLMAKVNFSELLELAREVHCHVRGSEILPPNQDAYNRLLIYACVRPALKRPSEMLRLVDCVAGMSSWDAHYWASAFRVLWWSRRNLRGLRKAVRAFKLFFNIG